jgi:hypothetical protein
VEKVFKTLVLLSPPGSKEQVQGLSEEMVQLRFPNLNLGITIPRERKISKIFIMEKDIKNHQ